MYANSYKRYCYLVLTDLILIYKTVFFITDINANMQCFICLYSTKKKKVSNLVKCNFMITKPTNHMTLVWIQLYNFGIRPII